MKTTLFLATILTAHVAMAQVMIPDGTKIRVRLEQNLSSETAELGQTVDFAVTQEVRVSDTVVIANGARATGSITVAQERGRMGKAGKLDFSIDRVQLVDGGWLNLRYTPNKNKGQGKGMSTGLMTAGVAAIFWPAAPFVLVRQGKDATIIKGRAYDVFSDDSIMVKAGPAATIPAVTRELPQAQLTMVKETQSGSATLNINSSEPGAEIELDGMFVGSAPAAIQVPSGKHHLAVRSGANAWEKDIQITSGTVSINAVLSAAAPAEVLPAGFAVRAAK